MKPCKNGATCVADNNQFKCYCRSGYTGRLCEQGGSGHMEPSITTTPQPATEEPEKKCKRIFTNFQILMN